MGILFYFTYLFYLFFYFFLCVGGGGGGSLHQGVGVNITIGKVQVFADDYATCVNMWTCVKCQKTIVEIHFVTIRPGHETPQIRNGDPHPPTSKAP